MRLPYTLYQDWACFAFDSAACADCYWRTVWCYARCMRWPVLTWRMMLPGVATRCPVLTWCMVLPDRDSAALHFHASGRAPAICLHARYAMFGTGILYVASCLRAGYAMPGTDMAYAATRIA
eukprot:1625017-Rhodomonas_salina.1